MKKILLLLTLTCTIATFSQEFDANLQLRPRYEYRNGIKTLLKDGELPTSIISQRSRLNLNFKQEKIKAKLTLQNVRIWGDVTTTATSDKNGVAIFEGWASYNLDSIWSVKVGRQVISYDNQRIFGEIDWAQQGQSHDAAILTFQTKKHQLDLGFAMNTNSDIQVEPAATIANAYTTNYKAMEYAWYHTQFNKIGASVLFANVGYQYLNVSNDLKTDYNQTFGTYLTYKTDKWDTNLGVYGQTGKKIRNTVVANVITASNVDNLYAYYVGANVGYAFTKSFKAALGYEFLSGQDQGSASSDYKSFSPIFGTNHGFNGYMDYFYVGNHQNSVGLHDGYAKLTYTKNKLQFNLMPHLFSAPNVVKDALGKDMTHYLGTEIDFTTVITLQKDVVVTAGYSQMLATSTLERLKGGNNGYTQNWAWLMVNINPRIFTSK